VIESNKNKLPKARLGKLVIDELSIVDRPCQEPATVALMKRAPDGSPSTNATEGDNATNKSTSRATAANVNSHKDKNMDELQQLKDQVAALTAELASMKEQLGAAKSEAELTDEEKAHAASLSGDAAKSFRALAKDARGVIIAKAKEGAIVFEGQTFLKGTQAYSLAVKVKEQADAIEKAAVRKLAAETIGALAGVEAVHDAIIKAVRASGESAEMQEEMFKSLRGANALMLSKSVAPGFGGSVEKSDSPEAQLDALTAKHAAANGITKSAARVAVLKTAEGRALYAASIGR
jgi:hypothetical protein